MFYRSLCSSACWFLCQRPRHRRSPFPHQWQAASPKHGQDVAYAVARGNQRSFTGDAYGSETGLPTSMRPGSGRPGGTRWCQVIPLMMAAVRVRQDARRMTLSKPDAAESKANAEDLELRQTLVKVHPSEQDCRNRTEESE